MNDLYLILGPSGVGKSTIIDELRLIDARFAAVPAYTTRPARAIDSYRISLTEPEFDLLQERERLLALNLIYGYRYGTSGRLIREALHLGRPVVVDCPVDKTHEYKEAFPDRVHTVYLMPASVAVLRQRLATARRAGLDERLRAAVEELAAVQRGNFDQVIDRQVVAVENGEQQLAAALYNAWRSEVPCGARP